MANLVIAAAALSFLSIFYFYIYLPNSTNHGETITVPDLEGMDLGKIDEFLSGHDLRYEVSDSSYSDEFPPLTVLQQFPKPGSKVKENRKVYITINRVTPPTVPMPDLVRWEDGIRAAPYIRGLKRLRRIAIECRLPDAGRYVGIVGGHWVCPFIRWPSGSKKTGLTILTGAWLP